MMLRFALFAATVLVVSAKIPVNSKVGKELLSKSKSQSRRLNDQEAWWITGYTMRFQKCHTVISYNPEEADAEDGSPVMAQRIISYELCPTGKCGESCEGGGEYIAPQMDFLQAWTEYQMQKCEMVEEQCYCDNANNEQQCLNECYYAEGLDYCIEDDGDNNNNNNNEEEFNLEEYIECREMENQNGNNNQAYFVGPYCSADGKGIYLGVFSDETCTTHAEVSLYGDFNYGRELPYSKQSIVTHECINCMAPQENENNNNNNNGNDDGNNNNNQDEDEALEMCEQMYEVSGKCEQNLNAGQYFYPKVDSCSYIHDVLPKYESADDSDKSGGFAAKFFAVFFAVATVGIGFYAYTLYKKVNNKVSMASTDMEEKP